MIALSPDIGQLPTKRSTYQLPLNKEFDPYRYPHADQWRQSLGRESECLMGISFNSKTIFGRPNRLMNSALAIGEIWLQSIFRSRDATKVGQWSEW